MRGGDGSVHTAQLHLLPLILACMGNRRQRHLSRKRSGARGTRAAHRKGRTGRHVRQVRSAHTAPEHQLPQWSTATRCPSGTLCYRRAWVISGKYMAEAGLSS
ncbi:hypothetical protein NDU88_000681 [Pleurodeles waltl]|uniref:Uncharacterized protein n=1 Tax=Pleurodeles waltl TaxID=8319 RepID=A0AAV7TG59_PLEWA|nr:hypothetical protein NDU88_000681 [Pleurodeles waltl]